MLYVLSDELAEIAPCAEEIQCRDQLGNTVGLDLFIVSSITGISIDKVTAKVMPYLLILLADLVILTYIPSIITFLPNMLR